MERREHRFTMDRSGHILDGTPEHQSGSGAPEAPVEEIPDEEWRRLGELDPITGRSTVDLEEARRWQPLGEFLWRR